MVVGILKEIMEGERRVSATPESVAKYVELGHSVLVERGAGEGSLFSDGQYEEAGAGLCDVETVYARADIILKVKEPQFDSKKNMHEADMLRKGQYLITFLHPASPSNHDMVRKLAENGVVSLTLDSVPRISRAQSMDALTSMSTCAGYKGMLCAIDSLAKFAPQIFSAVGMIKPAKVFVLGAGVAGLQAIATAKRLGAVVYAADIRPDAAEQARSLGAQLLELGIPKEEAVGEGGYANALSEDRLQEERAILKETLRDVDVVFLSALVPGKQAPVLVDDDIISGMRPGSVITDISIDQGGNCSETAPGEIITKHGVMIQGIKNIPGMLPASSTWMFSQNMYNLFAHIFKDGELRLRREDDIIQPIIVTIDGEVVHAGTLEAMAQS